MDSHSHGFSTVCGLSHLLASANAALGSGTLWPVIKNTGALSQKATRFGSLAPSDSTVGLAQGLPAAESGNYGFLNSSVHPDLSIRRTILMSPLLNQLSYRPNFQRLLDTYQATFVAA